jgi:hypothetical protein
MALLPTAVHVRFGSQTDTAESDCGVCFTPETRHSTAAVRIVIGHRFKPPTRAPVPYSAHSPPAYRPAKSSGPSHGMA